MPEPFVQSAPSSASPSSTGSSSTGTSLAAALPGPPAAPPASGATTLDLGSFLVELDVGWSEEAVRDLEAELEPWTAALRDFLGSGEAIPSHIPGAGAVALPITPITDPQELFDSAEGEVGDEAFTVTDRGTYRVTVHHSTVPVVMLLLKEVPSRLPRLDALSRRCGEELGRRVGGPTGTYLQWNQAGFRWQVHTDDEFDGVFRRVHVPLVTTPENWFAFAARIDVDDGDWLLRRHLPRGHVYCARVDVPHTAGNDHRRDGRLHLILDVEGPAS